MRNRVERLRIYLLGSAVLLVLVIGTFIGMARYVRHLMLAGLATKLGVNVESDASGWTYSQSRGSQTLYTIHAAKWEKRTNGTMVLHDVSILLYGQKGLRHDRIYGDEFEYDKGAGVVRATGIVHIDLQSADAASKALQSTNAAAKAPHGEDSGANLMHVKTSGLVYLEKLGVAATSEYIDFQGGGMTGHATGADYSSDSGVITLHSAVDMSGTAGGHPTNVRAATAEFNDQSQQAHLTHATYDSQGRKALADDVIVHRRPDGTLSQVEAHGDVTGVANGASVVSQRADVSLTAASLPQTVVLTGGVKYSTEGPLRQMKGESDAATIAFDGRTKPQPEQALFTGAVHVTERTRATMAVKEPWSTRDLTAARLEVSLERGAKGEAQVRDAAATGSPHLTMVNNGSLAKSKGQGTTELSADDLKAHLIASVNPKQPPQVDTIVGRGHTVLHQLNVDGVEQTTAGDTLDAKMRPGGAIGAAKRVGGTAGQTFADSLSNAVQVGHVTMMHRSAAKPKTGTKAAVPEEVVHASAQRALYDGDQDRMTLSGGVAMADASSGLWADQVVLDHKTNDAHAVGGVKMNYVQDPAVAARAGGPSDQPTHILADRAEIQHATKIATFYGKPVRMWQGGNQVQAPVIEVAKAEKRLTARGEGSAPGQVHTVLAAGASDVAGTGKAGAVSACSAAVAKAGAAKAEKKAPDVVRVASGGLIYSDSLKQADFTGGFRADTVDGTIRAGGGTIYMEKKAANVVEGGDAADVPSLGGNLDHVVASGHVELDKPGMHATGERLVYTASDRIVLLTGDAKAPPRAVGAQGTTTGATLRFNSCDGSVEALGAAGERVLTDARISNEDTKDKGKR